MGGRCFNNYFVGVGTDLAGRIVKLVPRIINRGIKYFYFLGPGNGLEVDDIAVKVIRSISFNIASLVELITVIIEKLHSP